MTGPFGRWAVLIGAWGIYVTFGLIIVTTGALVPLIREDLGLSRSEMGVVLGAWQFVYIVTSIPSGRLLDRIGPRRALIVSAVIMLSSGFLRAVATGFTSLLLAVALLGVGAPIISIGAPKVAASLFDGRDRRRAVGIYGTAPGVGGVIGLTATALIGRLVGQNWRTITALLTIGATVSLIAWLFVSRELDEAIEPGTGPELGEYLEIARRPVVRFILAMSIMNFFASHGVGQWQVPILADAGWSNDGAALWAAFGTLFGLIATFVVPRLAIPERRLALIIGVLLLGAAGVISMSTTHVLVLIPALVLASSARTAMMPILVMVMMDHRDIGASHIAAASGLFFSLAQIGGVAGPALTGVLSDASGGFQLPLTVHAGLWTAMACTFLVGYRPATR